MYIVRTDGGKRGRYKIRTYREVGTRKETRKEPRVKQGMKQRRTTTEGQHRKDKNGRTRTEGQERKEMRFDFGIIKTHLSLTPRPSPQKASY